MTEQELGEFLRDMVGQHDMEWIVYHLTEGAVKRRNEADEGDNRAEQKYWQKLVVAMTEFQTKLENLGD